MSKFRSKVSKFSKPPKPLWQKIQTNIQTTMEELVPQMSVGLIYDNETAEIDNEPDLSDLYAYETFFGGDNPTVLIEEVERALDVVKEVETEVEPEVETEVETEAEIEVEVEVETEVEVEVVVIVPDATKRIRSILKKKSIIDVVMELQREALREKLVNLKKKNIV
jgi:hypothetical protein